MAGKLILDNALQSYFDNMNAFILLKDTENRLVKVNRQVAEVLDLTPEDMAGHHCREFYGEQADRSYKDDLEVIRSGIPKLDIIESLPLGERRLRWVRTSKIPVRDDGGDIVGILVIANDIAEESRAERQLTENRVMVQTIVENFQESLALYGPDQRLKFANRTFWALHEQAGLQDLVKIGDRFEDIARSIVQRMAERGDVEHPAALIDQLLKNHMGQESEYEIKLGRRWIRVHRYPTPDGGRIVFGHNITEKKKAEEALEESQDLLHTVVENFSEVLALYDPSGCLKFGNRTFWQFHKDAGTAEAVRIGATREENARAIAKRLSELDATLDPQSIVYQLLEVHQDPNKDAEFLWGQRLVRLREYPTPDGGMIILGNDVTASHEAERALKESEMRYQTLAETAPVGIFRTTEDGTFTYRNDVWHRITGTAREDVRDSHWTSVFEQEDRQRIASVWRSIAIESGVFHTDGRIGGKHGDETWVLATIAAEDNSNGKPSAFVGTITDISKLKQVETRLRDTERALRGHKNDLETLVEHRTAALRVAQENLLLQERLAAIGQLTATVSHELRNPLGTITTSFAVLKRRIELSDQKSLQVTERIERNIKRCETIIADLLDYTRIETLNCEPVDLDTWISQFLGELELPDDVTLNSSLNATGKARMDRVRMGQVMANLVSNALDAMAEDPVRRKTLEVETGRRGENHVIQVRDVGEGLDPKALERVFEPLISSKTFGVGLGLPLVRQIVERHGGKVEIRNRRTRGAEVEIELPAQLSDEPPIRFPTVLEQGARD